MAAKNYYKIIGRSNDPSAIEFRVRRIWAMSPDDALVSPSAAKMRRYGYTVFCAFIRAGSPAKTPEQLQRSERISAKRKSQREAERARFASAVRARMSRQESRGPILRGRLDIDDVVPVIPVTYMERDCSLHHTMERDITMRAERLIQHGYTFGRKQSRRYEGVM